MYTKPGVPAGTYFKDICRWSWLKNVIFYSFISAILRKRNILLQIFDLERPEIVLVGKVETLFHHVQSAAIHPEIGAWVQV